MAIVTELCINCVTSVDTSCILYCGPYLSTIETYSGLALDISLKNINDAFIMLSGSTLSGVYPEYTGQLFNRNGEIWMGIDDYWVLIGGTITTTTTSTTVAPTTTTSTSTSTTTSTTTVPPTTTTTTTTSGGTTTTTTSSSTSSTSTTTTTSTTTIFEEMSMSISGNIATASYPVIASEKNKPPTIEDGRITGDAIVGSVLSIVMEGTMHGPFTQGAHEYQWYTLDVLYNEPPAGPVVIPGATSITYAAVSGNLGKRLVAAMRFVQVEGINNKSEWFYTEPTAAVTNAPTTTTTTTTEFAPDGDITHPWNHFFNIESGASVASNWNIAGQDTTLFNLGLGPDWTAVSASKPTFSTNKLVFAGAHKVTGSSLTFPPVLEIWVKGRFTANNGAMIGWGSQTLFGINVNGDYNVGNEVVGLGNFNEHVWRIVLKTGTNASIFQVDNGPEVLFTNTFTTATTLALGQTFSGANFGDCEIKRLQFTQDNVFLTAKEVSDKWKFHGFSDISHAWLDSFNIESSESVPSNWNNAGISPSLINLGTGSNYTTVEATKPLFSTNKLVFTNAHKVSGTSLAFPPEVEIWIKGKFTANNGAMVGWGSQTLFGIDASGNMFVRDVVVGVGNFNEHIFRIVLKSGVNASFFQMDNGAKFFFTNTFTTATTLALGQTFTGSNPADCEIKKFQRTNNNTFLTTTEEANKWANHGM